MEHNKIQLKLAKKFYCQYCNYTTYRKNDCKKHILTQKHKKHVNLQQKVENVADIKENNYTCNICQYKTDKLFNYNKHVISRKHKKLLS